MGIQRWDIESQSGRDCLHLARDDGDYVLFADHEAILEQVGLLWAHKLVERDNEIERLRAELAAKSKDAARYAWLTNPDFGQLSISDVFNAWWRSENGHPETINDAIDLAMKQDEEAIGEGNGR